VHVTTKFIHTWDVKTIAALELGGGITIPGIHDMAHEAGENIT